MKIDFSKWYGNFEGLLPFWGGRNGKKEDWKLKLSCSGWSVEYEILLFLVCYPETVLPDKQRWLKILRLPGDLPVESGG
ncbi:MAG TPA: hypothetical protein VMI35_15130 [Puia sp.]|nr:hypothetical protein [Puia sp.]